MTQNQRDAAAAIKVHPHEGGGPKIVAKGMGWLAAQIIERAKEENVPIVQDGELAQSLCRLDVGDHLPEELFPAVAEMIAYIYKAHEIEAE